ncbi:MAG: tetratricopeptide repeat protein [Byssovorax sp.]
MRRRTLSQASAILAGAIVAIATIARADVPSDKAAQAEALFRERRDLMAAGDFDKACPKLRASHELDPGYGAVYNLGDCLSKAGKTASAWAAFREAADMARKADQAERVEKAERRAGEIEPKLEKLSVSVAAPVADMTIKRDGIPLDRAAWGTALPIDPGKHVIAASAPGKKPWSVEVATRGPGETVSVAVPALEDLPVPKVTPPPPPRPVEPLPEPGLGTRKKLGLGLAGGGAAVMIVGGALGGLAAGKWSTAQDEHCRTDTLCDATGVTLVNDAKTFAAASTGLFIGGGVLLAGGAAIYFTAPSRAAKAASLKVTPVLGATQALVVSGSF